MAVASHLHRWQFRARKFCGWEGTAGWHLEKSQGLFWSGGGQKATDLSSFTKS